MDWITILVQLAFGWAVKKWPVLATWPNKLIPVFNFILAILIKLSGVTAVHADTTSAVPLQAAHHPGWWAFWTFIQPVLLNTLLATGIFSTGKNIQQHLKGKTP